MASQEYKNVGAVSPAMIMVCIFQLVYVLDALLFEVNVDSDHGCSACPLFHTLLGVVQ